MKYMNDDCWRWEFKDVPSKTNLEFQILINDEIWSTGDNYTASNKNNEVCLTFQTLRIKFDFLKAKQYLNGS
jgi:hypothetical protein